MCLSRGVFELTCADCAGQMVELTASRPSSWEQKRVYRCADCRKQFLLSVHLSRVANPDTERTRRYRNDKRPTYKDRVKA